MAATDVAASVARNEPASNTGLTHVRGNESGFQPSGYVPSGVLSQSRRRLGTTRQQAEWRFVSSVRDGLIG
jgi:hypothetical protein